MTTQQATAQQAEQVADALMEAFNARRFGFERPTVKVDDWDQGRTVLIWTDGPYGWSYTFPFGGYVGNYNVPSVQLPTGVWTEAYNDSVMSVWYDDDR